MSERDLPTPVGGDDGPDVTFRYGESRFDGVGLFIQWLVEQVNGIVAGTAMIQVELRVGYAGRAHVDLLILGSGTRTFKKRWMVDHLNELLLADDGRGGLLKQEVRMVLAQIREHQ
jgi:hypothetical protein